MGLRRALGLRTPKRIEHSVTLPVTPEIPAVPRPSAPNRDLPSVAQWEGYCPICRGAAIFKAHGHWFRDNLFCQSCPGGSIPRERAMMVAIDRYIPNWRNCTIHESSPGSRGLSVILKQECKNYTPTQYFPDHPGGSIHNGMRCEDLEHQTFSDEVFDLVVTQDVMEHVFHPELAYKDIVRTLKPGGFHVHTTPIYKGMLKSERCAEIKDGEIIHLTEPEYHGNPVGDGRALVTFRYGYDLPELISSWTLASVEVWRPYDRHRGLVAEFLEVIICQKQ